MKTDKLQQQLGSEKLNARKLQQKADNLVQLVEKERVDKNTMKKEFEKQFEELKNAKKMPSPLPPNTPTKRKLKARCRAINANDGREYQATLMEFGTTTRSKFISSGWI